MCLFIPNTISDTTHNKIRDTMRNTILNTKLIGGDELGQGADGRSA
jgi:hypothetical protein